MTSFKTPGSRRLALSAAVGACALAFAPSAIASPDGEAKDLFARGRELRNANDCGSAAPLFRKAWTIYPQGLGSLRNLAECEEQLGHFASSRRSWLELRRALITAPNDPKYEGWDKDSEDAAARLKPRVASFVVDVYVRGPQGEELANDHSGVEIFVNGESVGTTLVGTPLERDPGSYLIRAQRADAPPVEQTVILAAGDNPHVTIRLERALKPAASSPSSSSSTLRTVGWVALGVGGASLVASAVTFLVRDSSLSEVEDKCAKPETGPCPTSLKGTIDTGELMSVLSPVFLGVGVIGVGGGLALILSNPSHSSSTQGKGLFVTPSLGRLDATWRF